MGQGAGLVRPAVREMVRGREAQRLLQLPRPPRGGRQRRPRRLPLARRGGRGARHHLRRAALRRAALRQRAQGPGHRQGGRGRDLPADDPGGGRRDARLHAHRRRPQRRVRRLQRHVRARADGVLRGQGARHGRRRATQGQDRADQAGGRRGDGRAARDDRRRPPRRGGRRDAGGPRPLVPRADRGRRRGVPREAARLRAPAASSSTRRGRRRSPRGSCTPRAAT